MNKNLILTDCDGVLLNWENSFIEWMSEQGFTPAPDNFGYDMSKRFGEKKAKIKSLVREFNNSAWIGFLKPHLDAVWGVEQLAAKGWRFGAITSLSEDVYAGKMREYNLQQLFGDVFDFVTCIDTGADKDEALLPYKDSGLYWLEDKPENAKLGADLGLKTIMLRHKHNASFDDARIKTVDNWAQLVNYVN
jgi:phosphoglycolate phosphatase-like HAD superfamily hydrolase|tara:strand:- start:5 stop:577 length:573 start_codon:yes stop_codon:yes gene_type:complete